MKSNLKIRLSRILPGVFMLGMISCTTQTDPGPDSGIAFLAFGDGGYHLDYLAEKDRNRPIKDLEQWRKAQMAANDDIGEGERQNPLPELEFIPEIDGYVRATGMWHVASAMEDHCADSLCQFSVMLGDNIYPKGAEGIDDDRRFQNMLFQPYSELAPHDEDFRIYAALGNHDWATSREGAMAQVTFMEETPPFYMDGIFYRAIPPATNGELEIFVIDTQILLGATDIPRARPDDQGQIVFANGTVKHFEWSRPQTDAELKMAEWLDDALRTSTAKWKIVIGHHPMWSSAGGKFAQSITLREMIQPSLCRYADAYFAGHEHTLELHEYDCEAEDSPEQPLPQIVSGAAGKQRAVNWDFRDNQNKAYPQLRSIYTQGMIWGYSHVTINGNDMKVDLIRVKPDETGLVYSHTFKHRSP